MMRPELFGLPRPIRHRPRAIDDQAVHDDPVRRLAGNHDHRTSLCAGRLERESGAQPGKKRPQSGAHELTDRRQEFRLTCSGNARGEGLTRRRYYR